MDCAYQLNVYRDEPVGALIEAELYRVSADGPLTLVAAIDASYSAIGIGDVLEALTDHLIIHQDEHGEPP